MSDKAEVLFLTKMSVKALGCKPKEAEEGKPAVPLCQILGMATGLKQKEEPDGRVSCALTGNFLGINLKTGAEFRSGKLYLPAGIHETVESAVKQLAEGGPAVRFGLEIRSIAANNPIGYSYVAKNLMPIEAVDELSDFRKALAEANPPKQIEATAGPAAQAKSAKK